MCFCGHQTKANPRLTGEDVIASQIGEVKSQPRSMWEDAVRVR